MFQGLECVDASESVPTPPQNLTPSVEETQQFCNPDEAIPLHYEPLKPARRLTPERHLDTEPAQSDADVSPAAVRAWWKGILL